MQVNLLAFSDFAFSIEVLMWVDLFLFDCDYAAGINSDFCLNAINVSSSWHLIFEKWKPQTCSWSSYVNELFLKDKFIEMYAFRCLYRCRRELKSMTAIVSVFNTHLFLDVVICLLTVCKASIIFGAKRHRIYMYEWCW